MTMYDLYVFSCGPLATNAFLLGCSTTKKAVVIDPSQGSAQQVVEKAKQACLHIEKILLTHSHWDHIIDVAELLDLMESAGKKISVYVHPEDQKNVQEPGSDGIPLLVPCRKLTTCLATFQEGEKIAIGNLVAEVMHTPGHSPGSVCFYFAENHLLFSGDTLFRGSIGTLDLPTADPKKMWASLSKLAKLPQDVTVYPGHGQKTTLGRESWLKDAESLFGR